MGTSSSFSSPNTPRWNAFNRALDNKLPVDRLRVTLFLAGEEAAGWREALDEPALATFAEALVDAHGTLADRLANAERPAPVFAAVVSEARATLFEEAFSSALPVAERALRAVLIETAQGAVPLADATGSEAAQAWERNRGAPSSLVQRYVGELFAQWAAHVMARDTGRLLAPEHGRSTAEIHELTQSLKKQVAGLAREVSAQVPATDIGSYWHELIGAVFDRGRQLEPTGES